MFCLSLPQLIVCIILYISTNLFHLHSSSLTPARPLQPGVIFGVRPTEDVRWIPKAEARVSYRGLKSNAVGFNGILLKFLKFLKLLLYHTEPFLTHILNFIFSFTIFPSAWKMAKVFPVHKIPSECELKDTDRQTHQYFRCRRLWIDMLMDKQIMEFLNCNFLLIFFQSGLPRPY